MILWVTTRSERGGAYGILAGVRSCSSDAAGARVFTVGDAGTWAKRVEAIRIAVFAAWLRAFRIAALCWRCEWRRGGGWRNNGSWNWRGTRGELNLQQPPLLLGSRGPPPRFRPGHAAVSDVRMGVGAPLPLHTEIGLPQTSSARSLGAFAQAP